MPTVQIRAPQRWPSTRTLTRKNTLETTLYDGVTLVSTLLRLGHYTEASSLASQLLVHFPHALPLHVGVGRALLAMAGQGEDSPPVSRAIRHLRRVLEADPENWRIRLETVLLYLRGDQPTQADHELWLTAQLVPDNRWLRDLVDVLPDNLDFVRIRQWKERGLFEAPVEVKSKVTRLWAGGQTASGEDEAGLARLYLRRKMPWMAVQYFEAAVRRYTADNPTSRPDLKTGLLLSLWQNGESQKASALASEILLDQPQLIMPRLLLTSHLAKVAVPNEPQTLAHLLKPVWQQDPFLERSTELAQSAGLVLPPSLWPPQGQNGERKDETKGNWSSPIQPSAFSLQPSLSRPVSLQLGDLDRGWLESVLQTGYWQASQAQAGGGQARFYHPHSELSYSLTEFASMLSSNQPSAGPQPKGQAHPQAGHESELDKIAQSIARIEELLYGPGRPAVTGSPRAGRGRPRRGNMGKGAAVSNQQSTMTPGHAANNQQPAAGDRPAADGNQQAKDQPIMAQDPAVYNLQSAIPTSRWMWPGQRFAELSPKGTETANGPAPNHTIKTRPAPLRASGKGKSPAWDGEIAEPQGRQGADPLLQPTTLVVSSAQALRSKYGDKGYGQIVGLLNELIEVLQAQGVDGRLLLVDNAEALQRYGYGRLDPVDASRPDQVRELLNAALPGEKSNSPHFPNTIFIIGGPDIIPFWRLPNPTFDSDREILSDNPYGARDETYLLPERIVGRLPDASGRKGGANLDFLLAGLTKIINRQRLALIPHAIAPGLPMRLLGAMLPGQMKPHTELEDQLQFEREWLSGVLNNNQFMDKSRVAQLAPFFYSAEAWKHSTAILRDCVSAHIDISFSPPLHAGTFDDGLVRSLARARLLHFNLHGFRDNPNWYGQSQAARLVASPSLSSLPVAFQPSQAALLQAPTPVVFSEACYGGYLSGKGVEDSIALSLLAQGSSTFVGSTAISYGSAGPELSCAGRLSYYFWKEVLQQGSSFGRALQAAKISYARDRLAAGYSLTGDDAKTLLEFSLLGNPVSGLGSVNAAMSYFAPNGLARSGSGNLPKGSFTVPGLGLRFEWNAEEEEKVRNAAKRLWQHFTKPRSQYQPVQYEKLPSDLLGKVEKFLSWILPDAVVPENGGLQAMIDLNSGYHPGPQDAGNSRPSWIGRLWPKGGEDHLFADWFEEPEEVFKREASSPGAALSSEASVLLSGQRDMRTADGYSYKQTYHLKTDLNGTQIDLNLSRGKG